MDDFYIVHDDKDYLKGLAKRIETEAIKNGITLHPNKTMICKLSEHWRYLQIQYSLTDTGRIIKKIHPKRLTAMRRKLKKLVYILSLEEFINYYNSWFKNYYKTMSKIQRENVNILFNELKGVYYV